MTGISFADLWEKVCKLASKYTVKEIQVSVVATKEYMFHIYCMDKKKLAKYFTSNTMLYRKNVMQN